MQATDLLSSEKHLSPSEKWMKICGIFVALVVFAAIYTMHTPTGMIFQAKAVLAVFGMAFVLWVTQAIPTYATSLVAMVLLVITGGWTQEDTFGVFGQDVIWLMISAFIITSAMEKSGFAKRMALFVISKFGTTPTKALISLIFINLALAFVIPSTTARAAITLPICLMILNLYQARPGESNFGKLMMIQQIHGNNISTSGIMTATAPQILAVSYITALAGTTVNWGQWFVASMPIAAITLIVSFFVGKLLFKEDVTLPPVTTVAEGEKPMTLKEQYKALGRITKNEVKTLILFFITVLLWATDGHHMQLYGFQISITMVAVMIAAIFFLPYIGTLNWKETHIPWDLMIFSCGAYAVGLALDASGGASYLLDILFTKLNLQSASPFIVYALVMFIASFSHLIFTSKTVRVAIIIPAIIALAIKLNMNPLTLALPASFTICDSITLPPHCKPNLIFYSSGYFTVKDQFVYGILVLIAKWILLMLAYFTWFRILGITH